MQKMKRDFKIKTKTSIENYFYLGNSDVQIAIFTHVEKNGYVIFGVDINHEDRNESYKWEFMGKKITAMFLYGRCKEALAIFKSDLKKIVWKKYKDENFKVGVHE